MESPYVNRARALRKELYNCAQAVACAFTDLLDLDESTLFRVMEGFGGGMGGHQATCGALSGAIAVIGLLTSKGFVAANTKAKTYELASKAVDLFEQRCGSLVCKDLLGDETGVELHPCNLCVEDAVRLVQELMGV